MALEQFHRPLRLRKASPCLGQGQTRIARSRNSPSYATPLIRWRTRLPSNLNGYACCSVRFDAERYPTELHRSIGEKSSPIYFNPGEDGKDAAG